VCVFSLSCPARTAHAPYFQLWPVRLYRIFPHYLINGAIFGKILLNTKCVFWFSLQPSSETFLILRRIQRDIVNVQRSSCKVTALLVIYRVSRGGCARLRRIFLKLKYTDVTKNAYIRSYTVTEIKAREKCGLLAVPLTVPGSRDVLPIHCACPSLSTAGSRAFTLRLHM